jgi:hypothetical protein
MSHRTLARTGAVLFILWGLLHMVGGGAILTALSESVSSAFGLYQQSGGEYPPVAGAVLGYLAYSFLWIGALVAIIGVTLNWQNSTLGLALNTALVGLTDLGLVIFLVIPGYVTWPEASVGIALFILAVVIGGLACRDGGTAPRIITADD